MPGLSPGMGSVEVWWKCQHSYVKQPILAGRSSPVSGVQCVQCIVYSVYSVYSVGQHT